MMLTRRSLLAAAPAALQARKPNFLFVIADDHAGYMLDEDIAPNLNRLASEGTRFASHYCNSPVCTPSRQSFLTGQMPHSAGVTVLRTPLAEDKPTIAKQLKQAGYQTAVMGKMHFNRASRPGLHGFDVAILEQDINKSWQAQPHRPIADGIRAKPPWKPFADPARIWLNAENLPYPRQKEDMRSAFLLRQASQYLEENRDKSFALWVSFQEPHSPFDFPVGGDLVKPSPHAPPRVGPEDAWQIPLIFRDLSGPEKQGIIAAYRNSVRYLDGNVGALLGRLRALGLEENTLVVYMADHGYSLGQHGRFEKHCGYDPALQVPLIMRWPARIRRGVVRDLTESVDVPHTILDLLGAPPLPVRHGQSLRRYLEGRKPEQPRDHIFSEYLENEEAFIRTAEHKLIYCSGKRERTDGYKTDTPTPGRHVRLFNLKSDPGEFTNVAAREPATVERLEKLMLARFRSTHPEAPSEPQRLPVEDALDWFLRPRDAVPRVERN